MKIDGEVLTDATTGLWDLSTKLQAEHKVTPEQALNAIAVALGVQYRGLGAAEGSVKELGIASGS